MTRVAWLVLLLLVALAYASALDGPFVYDDRVEVARNLTIQSLARWQAVVGYNVSRVLLILTYALDHHLWGLEPRGFHLTSLVIFGLAIGAALLMAREVGRLGGQPAAAGVAVGAVAVWALHPMATEAVTYITGRSESLCALFVFLALAAWARALERERQGGRGAGFRALGVLAFLGGVLTKEVGVMVPFAMLGLEVLLGPRPRRVRWAWFALFLLLVGLAAWLRYDRVGTLLHREVPRPLGVQLATSAEVWGRYLRLWLLPVGQTLFHHQPDVSPLSSRGVAAFAGLAALVAGGILWGRRVPLAGWALLAGALFLLPSTSIVPLKENMAEHRAFQTGLYLALAVGWSLRGRGLRVAALLLVLALPALVWATRARNAVWTSEVALWTEATERRPDSAEAWYGLGDAQRFAGAFSLAQAAFERSVELDPGLLDAWNNLGIARAELGDHEGARRAWREALKRRPSYCDAHNNLGSLALRQGEYDAAIAELKSTLAYCPDDVLAHYMLGEIYYGPRRDARKAQVHFEAVEALAPDFSRIDQVRQRLLELTW